jgi:hypothetical protein
VARQPHFHGVDAQLNFEQVGSVLTIRGHVPTFFLKQILQRALLDLDGVKQIDNRVEVAYCRVSKVRRSIKRV